MKMNFSILVLLLTTIAGCGLLGSDDKEPLEPGPRNYEWTVDTLHSPPGGFIYDIWGSSPDDVWAVAGTGINNLWHFDGEEWTVWQERVGPSFYSIYGFAQDDVWMGGNDGKLYHFDGTAWSQPFTFEEEEAVLVDVNSLWANASNMYATGIIVYSDDNPQGFVLHHDGSNWDKLLITDFKIQFQRIRNSQGSVFLQGINIHSNPDSMFFYQYKNQLKEVYSTTSNDVSSISLNKIRDNIYFVIENNIYKYDKNKLQEWLSISESNFGNQIYGRHEKDFFLRMNDGLAHYNGENIEYLFNLDHSLLTVANNAMLFDKEVFFIVRDYEQGTNYIYHGTLTEQEEE